MNDLRKKYPSLKSTAGHLKLKLWIILASCMLCFVQCEKDTEENEPIPDEPLNEWQGDLSSYLKDLSDIYGGMPAEQDETILEVTETDDEEYYYTTTKYRAAAGFDEQIVLNPTTDVIYPGALVKGESILDGSYTLIPASRKPITISTSLTGSESVTIEIEDPKLSTTRQAVSDLMTQEYSVPPANIGFEILQAYSEEQLALSLHTSYKGKALKISGGFNYNKSEKKTRLVVKFIQSYYTIDMDMPQQPSDLFSEDIDRDFFGSYAPMYVATVTYGRLALFTIESSLSEDSVRVYLEGSYKKVSGNASAEFNRLIATSEMKAYILGGSGEDASGVIDGFESFKNYIKQGGNYSADSPGAPISYKLRNIKDNSVANVVFAANYTIVEKIPKGPEYFTLKASKIRSIGGPDGESAPNKHEVVGKIRCWPEGKEYREVILWDYYGSGYGIERNVWTSLNLNIGEAYQSINDLAFMDATTLIVDFGINDYDSHSTNDYLGAGTFLIPMSEITADNTGKFEKALDKDNIQILIEITYHKN